MYLSAIIKKDLLLKNYDLLIFNVSLFCCIILLLYGIKNPVEPFKILINIFFILFLVSTIDFLNYNELKNFFIFSVLILCSLTIFVLCNSTFILGRAYSELNPIVSGRIYSLLFTVFCWYLFFFKYYVYKHFRLLNIFASIISFIGIIICGSRGPFIASITVLLYLMLCFLKIKFFIVIISLILFSSLIFYLFPLDFFNIQQIGGVFRGLDSINSDVTFSERLYFWELTIQSIINNPFGNGLGNFKDLIGFDYPHNLFLHLAFSVGVIFSFIFTFIIIFFILLPFFKPKILNSFYLLFSSILLCTSLNSLVSGDIKTNSLILLFIFLCLKCTDRNFLDREYTLACK